MKIFTLALFLALLGCAGAIAQGSLRIITLDVGQGLSTLLIGPSGKVLLVDGGENGQGNAVVVPALRSLGINHLDTIVATHYHSDHIGGLDEVINAGYLPVIAYDRGTFGGTPSNSSYWGYANSVGSRRRTISTGTLIDLGPGVTVRCITVNGYVWQRSQVNISTSSQFENSASIGLLVEYGSFDFWIGGDLTGGGNGTADVESTAASVVGDLDIYHVNHHGSNTSTNATWTAATSPEVALISAGAGNPYGHPTSGTVNRLSSPARTIVLLATSRGTGIVGPIACNGDIDLESDGTHYSIATAGGRTLNFLCDELAGTPPSSSELIISEVNPNPALVGDSYGEWFEISSVANGERSLRGLQVHGAGEGLAFTIAAPLLIDLDEYLVIARNGDPGANGGFTPDLIWPYGSFSLGNSSDSIALRRGGSSLDALSYGGSWPYSSGVSMERRDLYAPAQLANFAAASTPYGRGDLGTPGRENAANQGGGPFFAVDGALRVGGSIGYHLRTPAEAGSFHIMASAMFYFPGMRFGATAIQLNLDALFELSLMIPGMAGVVPPGGRVDVVFSLPAEPALRGFTFYSQAWTFDSGPSGEPVVSTLSNLVVRTIV